MLFTKRKACCQADCRLKNREQPICMTVLTRIGVGCLHLIDFDREGITNLNRQRYFARRLGQLKTDVMKETITEIASYCETVTDPARITEDDLAEFLAKEGFAAMPSYMYPDLDTANDG